MERGLLEYAVWVCHRDHDAFHIQWGVRHGLSNAYYGWEFDYAREDYVGEFLYSSETELDHELESSLGVYQQRRGRMISTMERYVRTEAEAKQNLIRWHGWWKEFALAELSEPADVRRHFAGIPTPILNNLFKFMKDRARVCRLKPEIVLWDRFAILKQYQSDPAQYDGNWWALHGRVTWAGCFREHLGDLAALLEPYDV